MNNDQFVILRSNFSNNDLLSSLGAQVRETRITGYLGYLLSINHPALLSLFKITERIKEIRLEFKLLTQRCDIIIISEKYHYIIEAKLYYENPESQLLNQANEYKKKYPNAKIKKIAISNFENLNSNSNIQNYSWNSIYNSLNKNLGNNNLQKILGKELLKHMENQGIIKRNDQFEIYAREVNKEPFLTFFLKGHTYFCKFEKSSNISKCSYFAPHFGKEISKVSPGIKEGISYIAKIKEIVYVDNFSKIEEIIKDYVKKEKIIRNFPGACPDFS
ncbi:MAG: hypothetical protein WHV26_03750 [Spirochaetota bacterium]